ncbi:dicarboxylate transporter/tellurite-resistance protein TehA [Caulobacter soli]|uniref:dicarboxylate transporter/tellurite-resistance protein TehA n=1 Tax=Caulobacter soli TaxID=2708539 RepID=UPI0013ECF593|nr:dicarboxylate transporter/tellurite-resistance protein TehA [Caulobacter soli]
MSLPKIPASYFGAVLGLAGLANAWRAAHHAWALSAAPGEALALLATATWLALLILYAAKWLRAPDAAREEARHPVMCCFIGLVGVATMLVALCVSPYWRAAALALFVAGSAFTLGFAIWRTGALWRGERDEATTTPVLYLPVVAGSFVTATVAAALGFGELGKLAFGGGLFAWLAIESVLLRRLYTGPQLPPALRPTLGIQLAPPVVGAVAYLSVNGGQPDLLAHALVGYGVLQALILVRLARWIGEQPLGPGYWAFTFGATALATATIRLARSPGEQGLAVACFVAANVVVLGVAAVAARGFFRAMRTKPAVA